MKMLITAEVNHFAFLRLEVAPVDGGEHLGGVAVAPRGDLDEREEPLTRCRRGLGGLRQQGPPSIL